MTTSIPLPPIAPMAPPQPLPPVRHRKLLLPLLVGVLLILLFVIGYYFLQSLRKPQDIVLTYYGLYEPTSVMDPLIKLYEASHPHVKITYSSQSPIQYQDRLLSSLASQSPPDIFRIHATWVSQFRQYLSPLPSSVMTPADYTASFYPTVSTDLKLGPSFAGIPLEYDGLSMFVNQPVLAQKGKRVPLSWDELRQTAISLSKCETTDGLCNSTNGHGRILYSGVAMGTTDNVDHWQDILAILLLQNHADPKAPTGQTAEDVLKYYTIFTESDHIWDSSLPNSVTAFAQNKVAIIFAPYWRIKEIRELAPSLQFSVYPLPQVPVDPSRGESAIYYSDYWVESVNKNSPNSAVAWDFLKFLSSRDVQTQFYTLSQQFGRGLPPSRVDLRDLPNLSLYSSVFLTQAPQAQSWYLVTSTNDSEQGINSRISTAYATAVNKFAAGASSDALQTLSSDVNRILASYGLVRPLPTPR